METTGQIHNVIEAALKNSFISGFYFHQLKLLLHHISYVCFKHFMKYLLLKIQDWFRSTILIFYVSTVQTF